MREEVSRLRLAPARQADRVTFTVTPADFAYQLRVEAMREGK